MKKLVLMVSLLSLTGCGLGSQAMTGVGANGSSMMSGKAVGPEPVITPVGTSVAEAYKAIHKAVTEKESAKEAFRIQQLDVTQTAPGKFHYKGWGSRPQHVYNISGDFVVGSGLRNHVVEEFKPEKPSNLPCTANPAACE